MITYYTRIDHDLHRFHEHIEHLVCVVWCHAVGVFKPSMPRAELVAAFQEIDGRMEKKSIKWMDRVRTIHALCAGLTHDDRVELKAMFQANNAIDDVCRCSGTAPSTYKDLEARFPTLGTPMKEFFTGLYDLLDNPTVVRAWKGIDDHYDAMVGQPGNSVCPFCGITPLLHPDLSKRDAYDHYMPESQYPFNSVNFEQLYPMCNTCNSRYKQQQDPLRLFGERKKLFFPFSPGKPEMQVQVAVHAYALDQLTSNQVSVTLTSTGQQEEVAAAIKLFGLDERYAGECVQDGTGHEWFRKALRMALTMKAPTGDFVSSEIAVCLEEPAKDKNFLRAGFLKGCLEKGLFNVPLTP